MTTTTTKASLRADLIKIIVSASARGTGRAVDEAEAATILDAIVTSDTAPEWDQCREPGRAILRQVIAIYRTRS